jgi:hypothetical protein
MYLLGDVCDDPEAIEIFLYTTATGFAHKDQGPYEERPLLALRDPRCRMRMWMHDAGGRGKLGTRAKVPALTQLTLIMEVWNHLCHGNRPRKLSYSADNTIYPWPERATPALYQALEIEAPLW